MALARPSRDYQASGCTKLSHCECPKPQGPGTLETKLHSLNLTQDIFKALKLPTIDLSLKCMGSHIQLAY